MPRSTRSIYDYLDIDLDRARRLRQVGIPVVTVPMDFIYLPGALQTEYRDDLRQAGAQLLVVGLTVAQLLSEVEFSLAITAAQMDPDEVDMINVDRYPD